MSIYASTLAFDNDEHPEGCGRWIYLGREEANDHPKARMFMHDGRVFAWDENKPCTCGGDDHAPILYRGSHVYPDAADRGGQIDFGVIPGHIAEGGGYTETHDHWNIACHRPFLRIGFTDPFGNAYPEHNKLPTAGTLVLDEKQVRELRDYLTDFLERISGTWCTVPETHREPPVTGHVFQDGGPQMGPSCAFVYSGREGTNSYCGRDKNDHREAV